MSFHCLAVHSFSELYNNSLCGYITLCLSFRHFRTGWLLLSFGIWNEAVMSLHVKVLCGYKFSISVNTRKHHCWVICLRICSVLKETAQLTFKPALVFCIPISKEWRFLLLHILTSIDVTRVFNFSHFSRWVVVSQYFILQFLNDIGCWAYFICLSLVSPYFADVRSFHIFLPKIYHVHRSWVVCFLTTKIFFCIFSINPLIDNCFAKIFFSQSEGCLHNC